VSRPLEDGWEKVGVVGVDAGLVWLGDPCYILHTKKPKAIGKAWGDLAKSLDLRLGNDAVQMNYDKGHPGLGVIVTSGYGDGEYPVEVRRLEDGTIAEVRVVFVREQDDKVTPTY
jgi:hypothetical protein